MTSAAAPDTADQDVFGGVDSDADTLHVAVISDNGGHLADAEFATTVAGYAAALAFLTAHGHVIAVEAPPPTEPASPGPPAPRAFTSWRSTGPTGPNAAASASPTPSTPTQPPAPPCPDGPWARPRNDTIAGIRALHNAACSAVKARTAALNQIGHLLITAPDTIRTKYGRIKGTDRTDTLARLRPCGDAVHTAVLTALKSLARRV
ncbi:hypothetical protein [Streptomyces sp. TRM68367]|uniref:hypothetical protein n=1 Tax=Streptomyces sp. TRM68367 TaxID=2758415 RepID=UPI0021CF4339|nr:hypothetical protein [Streptomyces sp. TRM68367]